jgi:DNA polymerase-3 subunit delta'
MWQTVGQQKTITTLAESIKRNTLSHAYLFVGPAHVGKMRLAMDLAMALNCAGSSPPCSSCNQCQRIEQGKHADVQVIDKNTGREVKDKRKATEIGIDAVREFIQRSANLPPYEGKRKVFIIDSADQLSPEAANCLLKTLEEPPPHVIIILLTTDEKKLLPTVISRCQRFELKPVTTSEAESWLRLSKDVSPEKVRLLARLSQGCLGWAMLANGDEVYLKERLACLTRLVSLLTASWSERFAYVLQLPNDRNLIEDMLKTWLAWCRDVLLLKYNCQEAVVNIDYLNDLTAWSNMLTVHELKEFIDSLKKSLVNLSANANVHLLLEVLMIDMPKKEKRPEHMINTIRSAA